MPKAGFRLISGYISGYDSAFGPSLSVAQQAQAQGVRFWLGYLGGPGAYHTWSRSEWAVLRQAGLQPGGLWVPTYGLAENPQQAAADAVAAAEALGLYGSVMLDTEEQMASSPHLVSFVDGFCAEVEALGRTPVVYDGAHYIPEGVHGFHVNWGGSAYPGSGQADQYGPATRFGMSVDVDLADAAFPLGSWSQPTPPPRPAPPIVLDPNAYPSITGGPMPSVGIKLPVGANGEGWGVLDGGTNTDPGSASLSPAVPITKFVSITPWTDDPAHDHPDTPIPQIGIQNRGGHVLVKVTGAQPGPATPVALVVYTD